LAPLALTQDNRASHVRLSTRGCVCFEKSKENVKKRGRGTLPETCSNGFACNKQRQYMLGKKREIEKGKTLISSRPENQGKGK